MNASVVAGLGVGGLGLAALILVVLTIRSFANRTIDAVKDRSNAMQLHYEAADANEDMTRVIEELESALDREKRANQYLQSELEASFSRGPVLDPGAELGRSLRKLQQALEDRHGDEDRGEAGGVHGVSTGVASRPGTA